MRKTPPAKVRKRPKKFTYRTTLSLDAELSAALADFARAEGIAEPEAARLAITRALAGRRIHASTRGTSRQLDQLRLLSAQLPNPYQDMLARWRLGRTERYLTSIGAFHLELDAAPPERYLMNILRELLHRLGPEDEFLTVTNVDFWADDDTTRAESVALYLNAQLEAINRGMRLSRVFVLGQGEERSERALERHRRFLQAVDAMDKSKNVRVAMRLISGAEAVGLGHFACVRRMGADALPFSQMSPDAGCLVVEPLYERGCISRLKLLFSRNHSSHEDLEVKLYLDRFFQIASAPETKMIDASFAPALATR